MSSPIRRAVARRRRGVACAAGGDNPMIPHRRGIPMILAARTGALLVSAIVSVGVACAAPAGNTETDAAKEATKIELVPHRAIYDLRLSQTRGSRGAESVTGRILYDFSGSS